MQNIFEEYEKYRKVNLKVFLNLMLEVKNEILKITEKSKRTDYKKLFVDNREEFCDVFKNDKNKLEFYIGDTGEIINVTENYTNAVGKLNYYLENNYPGIIMNESYQLKLSAKKIQFNFIRKVSEDKLTDMEKKSIDKLVKDLETIGCLELTSCVEIKKIVNRYATILVRIK